MTSRIQATAALLALALLPGPAAAQASKGTVDARRTQAVAAAPGGASFRSAGQDYRVVPTIRAVRVAGRAPGDGSLAAAASGPEVLERKGPYALVVERGGVGAADAALSSPVAVNQRSGQLGIVTGTITARVASAAAAKVAAAAVGVTLELFTPGSGFAFFRTPPGMDPLAAAAALAARPEVKGVEVEVREAFDEAQ